METFTAKYQLTKEEVVRAAEQHRKSNLRKSISIPVLIAVILLGSIALMIIYLEGLNSFIGLNCLVILLVCFSWLFRHKIEDWLMGIAFERRVNPDSLVEIEFTEEEIRLENVGFSTTAMRWKLIQKIVKADEGFIIYIEQPNNYMWLPFSAFEMRWGIEQFKEFATINGIKVINVGSNSL